MKKTGEEEGKRKKERRGCGVLGFGVDRFGSQNLPGLQDGLLCPFLIVALVEFV
jgi:hypothetical protein